MIVQMAAENNAYFIITMDQHTALAAQFAEHFGNALFEPIAPRAQVLHVVANHDAGWKALDKAALRDPATGLPYNLVQTPFAQLVVTSKASPDFNGATHPYCELLSSMHSWGLYNGRYGMSDKVLLNNLADNNRAVADHMLSGELARQDQLKAALKADAETAAWVEEAHLFQNYKQLQFFDTLALYFNCAPEGARVESCFSHIPLSATEDTEVTIKPVAAAVYALSPYPFDCDALELSFEGRYLSPVSAGEHVREALDHAVTQRQVIRLVAGD
jgi:hypothetical protein